MDRSRFSLVLRQCRENSGLTQKQVAQALNVERSTYAYYETGTTHPSGLMIVKLANIFNVSYTVFMEALSDKKFDDNAVNKEFPSINESSWRERERIYTLQKEEQDLIIIYRTLQEEQKEKVFEFIQTMKKQNQDKPRSEIKTEE
ncbi:MAG: helix-turn-helix domain-containing protein [Acutalibacteraceae bacterium]|nr:helix-turn-helix domain-containing protein [Clostridia bacterium]MEE3450054.1 helix-turn-helix domain-containing protein [Acutalibacteraceae bacterium]